jgi:hypothetical protein
VAYGQNPHIIGSSAKSFSTVRAIQNQGIERKMRRTGKLREADGTHNPE